MTPDEQLEIARQVSAQRRLQDTIRQNVKVAQQLKAGRVLAVLHATLPYSTYVFGVTRG